MKLEIAFRPEAEKEFREAISWYARQKKGLGKRFAAAVRQALKRLRSLPRLHSIVISDVRRAIVKGFPYVILYRVTASEIVVLAVFHTKRDPGDWHDRV